MGVKTIGYFVYDSSTPAVVSANGNVPPPTDCMAEVKVLVDSYK